MDYARMVLCWKTSATIVLKLLCSVALIRGAIFHYMMLDTSYGYLLGSPKMCATNRHCEEVSYQNLLQV